MPLKNHVTQQKWYNPDLDGHRPLSGIPVDPHYIAQHLPAAPPAKPPQSSSYVSAMLDCGDGARPLSGIPLPHWWEKSKVKAEAPQQLLQSRSKL